MKLTPITDEWREAFYSGRQDCAYGALGSRLTKKGAVFRVWAPDALLVSVVGDFNAWTPETHVMQKLPGGFWETEIEGLRPGDTYKYAINARDGQTLWKADPYGFWAERRPGSASRLYNPDGFRWTDGEWLAHRRAHKVYHAPLNVYEVHAGSWRRVNGEMPDYGYLTRHLIPYVKELGFTHIDAFILPVSEGESALLALIENLQRENLHYFEEAEAYADLLSSGMTQEALARKLGKSASGVANKLRLLKLEPELRRYLMEENLSERHARALLPLPDSAARLRIARQAAQLHLTVRETEALVMKAQKRLPVPPPSRKVISLVRDHRLYVNAIKSVMRQMQETGLDAQLETQEGEAWLEMRIRIRKNP